MENMKITLENGDCKILVKIEADKGKWVYATTEDGEILHTTWKDITTPNDADPLPLRLPRFKIEQMPPDVVMAMEVVHQLPTQNLTRRPD